MASIFLKWANSTYGPVLLGLFVLLVVGIAILTDFGASIDKDVNAHMGRLFLQTYREGRFLRPAGIEYFNGPFYFMIFTITSDLFHRLNPGWLLTDGLHLTNYLTFLVGVFFFYRIALRLFPRGISLLATALFATQPVLFGEAFILQKDTPLMAFFLASVDLGWTAVELRLSAEEHQREVQEQRAQAIIVERWRQRSRTSRVAIVVGGALGLVLLVDLWWAGGVQSAAQRLLGQLYAGTGPRFLTELFERIAEDAYKTPLSAYLAKLGVALSWMRALVSLVILAAALAWLRRALPASFALAVDRWFRRWGMILIAGCVLGLTTSIRVVAPFAGLLVAAYWIGQSGRRALPGLLVYAAVAAVTTYLTWPVLWGDPFVALTHRASDLFAGDRTDFAEHLVLFRSNWYVSGDLPWHYLPTLFAVQLTLPAVLLFLLGSVHSWRLSARDRDRRLLVVLIWTWLLVPVIAGALQLVPNYDNFRHILFCVPSMFFVMGYGAWWLTGHLRSSILRAALAAIALGPGVLGIVRLHPYEYVYYNELVGGVSGAEGKFDLDFGCTAFREAMAVVNRMADPGDLVMFQPWRSTAVPFARADLVLVEGTGERSDPDFALACRRIVHDAFPNMETVYEVRSEGALLAVVKQRASAP